MIYRWKELELITIQTLSNIITFIQFALTPVELLSNEHPNKNNKFSQLINNQLNSVIKFFSSPLDIIRKYNSIIGPIRTMLSALIFYTVILFLYNIFFLPSWRFIVLFLDIFTPGCFLFGILFISRKYDEYKKDAILLIIIGIIYFIIRITFYILHLFRNKDMKWYIKCGNRISSVFLSRLKKNHDCQDEITDEIRYQIDQETIFIQFDEYHFSYQKRIIDFAITFLIWIFLLIFVILGWEKVLKNHYESKNLEEISLISNIITYFLFCGMCLRLMFNIVWLIKPIESKIFHIFKFLHKLAYKGMNFLAGISLIPLLGIALKTINIDSYSCDKYFFFDTKLNADSLLSFFMRKRGIDEYCVGCTRTSINADQSCALACGIYEDQDIFYDFSYTRDSLLLTSTFMDLYSVPVFLFDLFYVSIFIFGLFLMYKKALDILVVLPAPTRNIECKFQTLINNLDSAALSVFRSYRYDSSLYSLQFSGSKLFVYFWTNFIFCGFLDLSRYECSIFMCFVLSFTSFFIAESQIFTSPYISILHNIVNFFSYSISGISAFIVGLYYSTYLRMSQQLVIFLVVIIIVTPILSALITPLFVKKDPLHYPTRFDLLKIQKWDKKLNEIINFRRKQAKAKQSKQNQEDLNQDEDDSFDNIDICMEDEPSVSVSYFKNSQDEREHDFMVSNFNLLKLAPIQIQEKLNKNDDEEFNKTVEKLWPKTNLNDECFDRAVKEMMSSANQLIDCICYSNLTRLFNFFLIFASACLGWCLASGIERWQKILSPQGSKYYLRCNMFLNGSFPAFGTY